MVKTGSVEFVALSEKQHFFFLAMFFHRIVHIIDGGERVSLWHSVVHKLVLTRTCPFM